jgi:hypothetical protein
MSTAMIRELLIWSTGHSGTNDPDRVASPATGSAVLAGGTRMARSPSPPRPTEARGAPGPRPA